MLWVHFSCWARFLNPSNGTYATNC